MTHPPQVSARLCVIESTLMSDVLPTHPAQLHLSSAG